MYLGLTGTHQRSSGRYHRNKTHKILRKVAARESQKISMHAYILYRVHCAVIFAVAQLSYYYAVVTWILLVFLRATVSTA